MTLGPGAWVSVGGAERNDRKLRLVEAPDEQL